MNSPYYFDFNSTAPLAKSLKDFLAKGVFFEANASSVHYQGKQSLKLIHQTHEEIKLHYDLKDYELVFTSGATEGVNWIVSSFVFDHLKKKQPFTFVCFASDHSVALKQREFVSELGGDFIVAPVEPSGAPNLDELRKILASNSESNILLNWTWVNNETGVVWDLGQAEKIKKEFDIVVHVDASQSPFKIKNYNKINHNLDYYSFSGHKFGSLKGVGFSFIHQTQKITPINRGGGQQTLRSGTLNTMGIYSLGLALKERIKNFNPELSQEGIKFLRGKLASYGNIMGAGELNLNTICFALRKTKAQLALIRFDLAKIAISSGSACTSGNLKPSHVISAMGSKDLADQVLRFSFEFDLTLDKAQEYLKVITEILDDLEG